MKTILFILIGLVLASVLTALILFLSHFRRRKHHRSPIYIEELRPQLETEARRLRGYGLKHLYCKNGRFRLHAQYLDQNSKRCAVLLHGVGGRGQDRFLDARYYLDRGYNLLFPDLRGNGSSAGLWQGMGHYEREDLLLWTEMMCKKLGPDCQIVIDGGGMGAAAALLFAGEGRERNLCAVVADSAFSSVHDLIRYRMRCRWLPAFLLLPLMRLWGWLLMGYDLNKVSPEKALEHCRVPVFFLHGEEDSVVPCFMVRRLSAACPAEKEVCTVPGAGHRMARRTDPSGCMERLDAFFRKHLPDRD